MRSSPATAADRSRTARVTEVAGRDKLRAKVRIVHHRPAASGRTVVQALPRPNGPNWPSTWLTQARRRPHRAVAGRLVRVPLTGKSDRASGSGAGPRRLQARRAWVPEITVLAAPPILRFRCPPMAASGVVAVLHEAGTGFATLPLADAKEIVLVIGPEGGIDDSRLADLTEARRDRRSARPRKVRTPPPPQSLGAIGVMTQRWSMNAQLGTGQPGDGGLR